MIAMKDKGFLRAGMVCILAIVLLCPADAFGLTIGEPQISKDGLVVEYRYMADEEAPSPQKAIQHDGDMYEIVSVSPPVEDPAFLIPVQNFSASLTDTVGLEGLERWADYFPASVYFEEGLFKGELPLNENAFQVNQMHQSVTAEFNSPPVRVEGLHTNDVNVLDAMGYGTAVYTTRSDTAPGATISQTLRRLPPVYEVTAYDQYGIPSEYAATIIYRGEERYLEPTHFEVTANYLGELQSGERHYLVTATYTPVEAMTISPVMFMPDPIEGSSGFPWGFLASAFAIASIPIIFFIYYRATRMRIVRSLVSGREKVVRSIRIKKRLDRYSVDIPQHLDLSGTDGAYNGYVPNRLVRRNAGITVSQNGATIYDRPAVRKIPLVAHGYSWVSPDASGEAAEHTV